MRDASKQHWRRIGGLRTDSRHRLGQTPSMTLLAQYTTTDGPSGAYYAGLLVAAVIGGTVVSLIARKKGYNPVLYFIFGAMVFIVAIIVVLVVPDKTKQQQAGPY